jgi:hypothetical protein
VKKKIEIFGKVVIIDIYYLLHHHFYVSYIYILGKRLRRFRVYVFRISNALVEREREFL